MNDTIYIIYNENFTRATEKIKLNLLVLELIKEQYKYHQSYCTPEEFMSNHAKFYEKLAPIYLKASTIELDVEDLKDFIKIYNDHFTNDASLHLHLKEYKVDQEKLERMSSLTDLIEKLDFHHFEELRELEEIKTSSF
ncbi:MULTISPECIES: hypothetical protein [Staphylococcus]|uniref:Uncharacterized protein n=1 Tax=Staphylococcus sp. CDC3 TaxID=678601 RepID=D2J708_9STAP|nr:hypothetical protein [Staphylococcus haemolyticus]ADA61639.1 hypothetical protein SAP020A_064 [Staphylococcus sp. CDC3]